jgi:hypothetical protein
MRLGAGWVLAGAVLVGSGCVAGGQGGKLEPYRAVVKDLPYTARTITTSNVRLANGRQVEREVSENVARNSQGFQWYKRSLDSRAGKVTWLVVWNPVNRTRSEWCSCQKVVYQKQFGEPMVERPRPKPTEDVAGAPAPAIHYAALPGKVLHGEDTEGLEYTRVVKAEGKDAKLTEKSWYAPSLHIVMLRKTDDPVRGASSFEVTELKKREPDPKLFELPKGYSVKTAGDSVEEQFE